MLKIIGIRLKVLKSKDALAVSDIRKIQAALVCPISLERIQEPVLLSCGHSLSREGCEGLKASKCPLDRGPFVRQTRIKDTVLERVLSLIPTKEPSEGTSKRDKAYNKNILDGIQLKHLLEVFRCPISGEWMKEPKVLSCGHVVSDAVVPLLEREVCPLDKEILDKRHISTHYALKKIEAVLDPITLEETPYSEGLTKALPKAVLDGLNRPCTTKEEKGEHLKAFETAIKENPKALNLHRGISRVYHALGNLEMALRHLHLCIKNAPEKNDFYRSCVDDLVTLWINQGEYKLAAAALAKLGNIQTKKVAMFKVIIADGLENVCETPFIEQLKKSPPKEEARQTQIRVAECIQRNEERKKIRRIH